MTRTYVIAEAGVNHDGSVDDALRLIDAASDAGADCVKFQTFRADALASRFAEKAAYQKSATDPAQSQQEMLRQLELPASAYPRLIKRAQERRVEFLSTPFDPMSVDFLIRDLGMKRIKIGSGDMNNAPMLLEVAKAGCEVILSTGMADLAEVEEALSVLAFGYAANTEQPSRARFATAWQRSAVRASLQGKVTLLHCTSAYPAHPETVNLKAMTTLAEHFGLPVGYSDHTLGIEVSMAAVARGAVMIEKHLTLDVGRSGPDHAASLEPRAFAQMTAGIRIVEAALGDGRKIPNDVERSTATVARKALVTARAIEAGESFTAENIALKRPAHGMAPISFWDVIGKMAKRAYGPDEAIDPP